MKYDIVIIGAGASGLSAAYQAIQKNPKFHILVIEKEISAGRKLAASGNGKCNLTNSVFDRNCYHSKSTEQIDKWVTSHSYHEILSFFEAIGILLYEKNGYYYPVSNQAKQVSTILLERSKALGVDFRFQTRVTDLQQIKHKDEVYYKITAKSDSVSDVEYKAKYVILATGGCAARKLGGCRDGYRLSGQLGIPCEAIYPVLSPIYVEDSNLSVAKGVRLNGNVTLKLNDSIILKEFGQIQFNNNNLSGIVMMNLSCYWNSYRGRDVLATLYIDVLPQYSWNALRDFFVLQCRLFPDETLESLLKGIFPSNFVSYITKRLHIDGAIRVSHLTDKQLNRLTSNLKKLEYVPRYVEDFEKAQVTGGGISLEVICMDTFESRQYSNLYLTGEVLDVNGKCGGYNLTFAVSSALQAANDIIDKCDRDKF